MVWQEWVCFLEKFWHFCTNKFTSPSPLTHLTWYHKFTYQKDLRKGMRKILAIYQSRRESLLTFILWIIGVVFLVFCRMGIFWMALRSVKVKEGCQDIRRYCHICPSSCWLRLDYYDWSAGHTLKGNVKLRGTLLTDHKHRKKQRQTFLQWFYLVTNSVQPWRVCSREWK